MSQSKININQDELMKMESESYKLERFDRNVKEMEGMLRKHKEKTTSVLEESQEIGVQIVDDYAEKRKKTVKNLKKRKIKAAVYIAAGIAIATAGYKGNENIQGRSEIISEFNDATKDFGIVSYSDGYKINEGEHFIDFATGVKRMVEKARKAGMNDKEIAIGLTDSFNKSTAQSVLGKENYPSYTERCELYQEAYHSNKAKDLNQNIEKRNGK